PAKPPMWHEKFTPLSVGVFDDASEQRAVDYLRDLITALHPEVQVQAGFEIVVPLGVDPKDPVVARAADFVRWLEETTTDEDAIKAYAGSIRAFFDKWDLQFDGVGFDFEIFGLLDKHRQKLSMLYQKTS